MSVEYQPIHRWRTAEVVPSVGTVSAMDSCYSIDVYCHGQMYQPKCTMSTNPTKKEQRKDKAALYPDSNIVPGPVDRSYLEEVGWAELFILATLRLTLPLLAQPNNPGH